MDNHNPYSQEPWDSGVYQTGSTQPAKNHRGLIAVLLIAVILCLGLASALGIMNFRLFQKLQEYSPEDNAQVQFSQQTELDKTKPSQSADQDPDQDSPSLELQTTPLPQDNVPQNGGLSLQEIYKNAIRSVVSISCASQYGAFTGTGVVISEDGYIVTNYHVIEDADTIDVMFSDENILAAQVVGRDSVSDLAVLRVDGKDLTPATFADSASVQVGDAVVAIGDPLGVQLRGTMTNGIISAINRDITTGGRTMTLLQTNAALNSGNSGGPLLNCHGQVIGINTIKIGDQMNANGVEGLGFAIPSATVKEVVDQLIRQGYVTGRPTLGFSGEMVSAIYQLYYGLPSGVYITYVDPESDAAKKGISPGDILMGFDGSAVTDLTSLQALLYAHQAGDSVPVMIYRGGSRYAITLVLEQSQ